MSISSEFIALCKAQIMLLTQAMDASISIVYLTQELVDGVQPQLIPIAAYPESLVDRERSPMLLSPAPIQDSATSLHLTTEANPGKVSESPSHPIKTSVGMGSTTDESNTLVEQRQIVLPLVFEDNVFGLLVTRRDDRAWEPWEQARVEEVARTLALACVLDQRYQWGQHAREQEQILRLQQHDLMANLLHQLRNSLAALQTFGKLILRRFTSGDRSHELTVNITRETERLRDLAQQMELALEAGFNSGPRSLPGSTVDSSILDEEQLGDAVLDARPALPHAIGLLPGTELTIERCLVETVLEPLLASAQAIAREKNLTLHMSFAEDVPPVWANLGALREALNNLLENAIKYTPAGGYITVLVEEPAHCTNLEISVSDTGPGIPDDDLPHIFERHFRGIQAQGSIPGSGLGLAITRSLIEQIHGKIQVFSPALESKLRIPGDVALATRGTTFLVQLPIAIDRD
jgi:hypothetical protein